MTDTQTDKTDKGRDTRMAKLEVDADLIRQLKDLPDDALLRVVRVVRDGDW